MPVVHVMRHPCGVVSSLLRGIAKNKMPRPYLFDNELALPPAQKRGLNRAKVDEMSDLEIITWNWLIVNEWVLENFISKDKRSITLLYEDVCEDPVANVRHLFKWCGLPLSATTKEFIQLSTNPTHEDASYYSVVRNSHRSANRWHKELARKQIDHIYSIVGDSVLSKYYPYS
jgi:hypothetical protein